MIRNLWNFTKVRYRGLFKNTVCTLTMLAVSNPCMARRLLAPRQETCA